MAWQRVIWQISYRCYRRWQNWGLLSHKENPPPLGRPRSERGPTAPRGKSEGFRLAPGTSPLGRGCLHPHWCWRGAFKFISQLAETSNLKLPQECSKKRRGQQNPSRSNYNKCSHHAWHWLKRILCCTDQSKASAEHSVLSHRPVNMNQNLTACYSWYFMVWTDYMTCKDNRSHSTTVSLVSGVFQSSRFSHHTTDHWRGVTRYKTFPLRGAYENSSSTTLMLQSATIAAVHHSACVCVWYWQLWIICIYTSLSPAVSWLLASYLK